ncbi:hypothetical protein [Burkholderia ubonensis]|uniref:hypothetical protein n=1 Tax=Burkholderia ubonensis TaxID=101571 RepID=UPI0012FBFA3E|nr:hypothetical protein [Burkholderia ubonensis]
MQDPKHAPNRPQAPRNPAEFAAYAAALFAARLTRPIAPIKAKIRLAAECSRTAILDRPVAVDQDLREVISLLEHGEYQAGYFDVPLTPIVALSHKNFATGATTWRELFDGLQCSDWDERALTYFESEIGATLFPSATARRTLDLSAYGGAVHCSNGNHRLVAAVVWLAARFGDTAVLRKVRVGYTTTHRPAVALIVNAVRNGKRVDIVSVGAGTLIRVSGPHTADFWLKTTDNLRPYPVRRGLAEWYRRRKNPAHDEEFGLRWLAVPPFLAIALADDGWLREQLDRPRTPTNPLSEEPPCPIGRRPSRTSAPTLATSSPRCGPMSSTSRRRPSAACTWARTRAVTHLRPRPSSDGCATCRLIWSRSRSR